MERVRLFLSDHGAETTPGSEAGGAADGRGCRGGAGRHARRGERCGARRGRVARARVDLGGAQELMAKVLVTGAGGYIGGALTSAAA